MNNAMHGANGMVAPIIGAPKMEFGEMQMRGLLEQVKKAVAANGGQMPIQDPAGLLSLGILLGKLDDIVARFERLENPAPAFTSAMSSVL